MYILSQVMLTFRLQKIIIVHVVLYIQTCIDLYTTLIRGNYNYADFIGFQQHDTCLSVPNPGQLQIDTDCDGAGDICDGCPTDSDISHQKEDECEPNGIADYCKPEVVSEENDLVASLMEKLLEMYYNN